MYHRICATFLLFVIILQSVTAHFIPDYSLSQYDDKSLEKLGHHHQDSSGNDNFCHGLRSKGGEKYFDDLMKINQLELKNNQDYPLQYSDEEDSNERSNTLRSEDVRPRWPKRSQSLAPFMSLGALSNLPAFFEKLKGTMDKLEEQQSQQVQLQAAAAAAAAAQAADAERSFGTAVTAAVASGNNRK